MGMARFFLDPSVLASSPLLSSLLHPIIPTISSGSKIISDDCLELSLMIISVVTEGPL
jgi:hypothetical protein